MSRATRCILAVAVLVVAGRPAGAEPGDLAYAGVACGDERDGPHVVLPGPGGVLSEKRMKALEDAADAAEPKLETGKRLLGETIRGGWCAAEKTLTIGKQRVPLRLSGVGKMTGHGADRLADSATSIARPVSNADAAKLSKAGALKQPAPIARVAEDAPIAQLRAALTGDAAKLAALWSKRADVILAGTAPGELYKGGAARATLAKWNLALKLVGGVAWGYAAGSSDQLAWAVANVEASPAKGGATTTYRVMFGLLADHAEADEDQRPDRDTWRAVLIHFALVE